ncbi:MAG: hypothetical protein ACOZAO_03190 [Patescibacteria group bacterium]
MKELLKRRSIKNILAIFFYLLVGLLLFKPIFSSKGIITGGDWSFPYTFLQLNNFLIDRIFSWGKIELVGGFRIFLVDLPFALLLKGLGFAGVSPILYPKLALLGAYVLAGFGMFYYLKYLKVKFPVALFGGLLYVFSPFFFNYTVMGWIYVLISMGIFPLFLTFFDRAVKERKFHFAALCGILFSLAFMQSTSIIWYSFGLLAIGITYVTNKKHLQNFILMSIVTYSILFLTHLYWAYNLFTIRDSTIFGSENVLSSVSLGTWAHLSLQNLIRGWGSLFNATYEYSYFSDFPLVSYALTILALLSLFIPRERKHVHLQSVVLFLIPIFLYLLGPERIALLPLGNVMRDVARMSVLISFSLTVLSILFINYLYKTQKYFLLIICIFVSFLSANPFWSGKFYANPKLPQDIRLRTYVYPEDYSIIESFIASNSEADKVMYIPTYSSFSDFTNPNFSGPYREMAYVFASMSPKQGIIYTTDKERRGINGYYGNLVEQLKYNYDESISYILSSLNVKYFVFYYNSMGAEDWRLYEKVSTDNNRFNDITAKVLGNSSNKVSVFEVATPSATIEAVNYVVSNSDPKESIKTKATIFSDNPELRIFTSPYKDVTTIDSLIYKAKVAREFDLQTKAVNSGWFWPTVRHKPGTLTYKLIRFLEDKKVTTAKDRKIQLELLLWHASKRAAEVATFGDANKESLTTSFYANHTEISELLSSFDFDDKDDWYYGYLYKLDYYLNESDPYIDTEVLQNDLENKLKFERFSILDSNRINCEELCYGVNLGVENFDSLYFVLNNSVVKSPSYTLISPNVLEIQKSKEILINQNDFLNSTYVFNSNEAKELLSAHWQAFEQVLSRDIFKYIFFSLSNAQLISIENWEPSTTYDISFDYVQGDLPIRVFIVEDVEQITSDFVEGVKNENIILKPKINDIKEIASLAKGTTSIERPFKMSFTTHPLAQTGYIYILNGNPETAPAETLETIKNFEISKPFAPDLYLTNFDANSSSGLPEIAFTYINPTKYLASVKGASSTFGLVLKQRFHPSWEVKFADSGTILDEENHYISDGYGNGWVINSESIGSADFDLVIEFAPQKYTTIGFMISLIVFGSSILFIAYKLLKPSPIPDYSAYETSFFKEKLKTLGYVLKENGIKGLFLIALRTLTYLYYKVFKKSTFVFNNKRYSYFYHWYNVTFRNERCVELPIAKEYLDRFQTNSVLEVGNVLSHYFDVSHDVVDKYEDSSTTIREDIVDFNTPKKYDLVISISTLEHVGWDEDKRDPKKFLKALSKMRSLLKPGGKLLVTMPMGWSDFVDNYVKQGEFLDYKVNFMKRHTADNSWKQVSREEIVGSNYNEPFPNANAIIIIEL